jgi:hypothetical protein
MQFKKSKLAYQQAQHNDLIGLQIQVDLSFRFPIDIYETLSKSQQ